MNLWARRYLASKKRERLAVSVSETIFLSLLGVICEYAVNRDLALWWVVSEGNKNSTCKNKTMHNCRTLKKKKTNLLNQAIIMSKVFGFFRCFFFLRRGILPRGNDRSNFYLKRQARDKRKIHLLSGRKSDSTGSPLYAFLETAMANVSLS